MSSTMEHAEVERALLRAFGTLSAYSCRHRIDVLTMQLNLFGMQSAGKSRFLNVFARRPLGFMKEGSGNKCPVQYQFQTADPGAEQCQITWRGRTESVDASEIYAKVQAVMDSIPFTADVLQVSIALVDAMTMCVVDMPGIRPTNANNAEQDNALIQEIWRTCAAAPSSIPILVTQLYEDPDRMDGELESLKLAMGAPPGALRRAIVVATHFDKLSNHVDCGRHMSKLQSILTAKGIGPDDNATTVFCSLKPEYLDPARAREPDNAEPTAMRAYFTNILATDAAMVANHVPRALGLAFKVGIQEAVRVMTNAVVEHFKANASTMLVMLGEQFDGIKKLVRAAVNLRDAKSIRKDADHFVSVYCAYLAALARWDASSLHETMLNCGCAVMQPSEVDLPHSLAMTFDEEVNAYAMRDSKFVKAFRRLEPVLGACLREQLALKLCGGSALLRLLRVWTVVVLKNVKGDYTVDEMQRMGCMTDLVEARAWSIDWCLKKMIQTSSSFLHSTSEEIGTWTRRLFSSHAHNASQVVPRIVTALADTPALRTQVTQQLADLYDQYLMRQVAKAVATISNNIRCHFKSLKLDAPFAILRLICSTEITAEMFAPPDASLKRAVTTALGAIPNVDASMLAFVSEACALQSGSSQAVVTGLFRTCTQLNRVLNTDAFALGEGIKLPRVLDTELREKAPLINGFARMFTYLHNGVVLTNACNTFDREVEQPVKQLDEVIRADLRRVLARLTDANVLAMAIDDAPRRLAAVQTLLDTLTENQTAQHEVLGACELLGVRLVGATPSHLFDAARRSLEDVTSRLVPNEGAGDSGGVVDLRDLASEVALADAPELTLELLQERDADIEALRRSLVKAERALAESRSGGGASLHEDRLVAQLEHLNEQRILMQQAIAANAATEAQLRARIATLEEQLRTSRPAATQAEASAAATAAPGPAAAPAAPAAGSEAVAPVNPEANHTTWLGAATARSRRQQTQPASS